MTINSLRKQKIPTIVVVGALLFTMFGSVERASAAVSAAPTGTDILTQNGGTVVTTFSPALGSTITASTTGATAYYGVRAVTSTSSPDVFWEITVSHATSTLAPGMVSITEKGWFDATGNAVADSPYVATVSGGDLVLTGNTGWGVALGDDFTNVDEIVFSGLAPLGTYTVTRVLMDTASSTPIDGPYVFSVDLVAAAVPDTVAPVFATTTDVIVTATTSASTTVNFVVTATDDVDGPVGVVCTPPSGSLFGMGTTTVTCVAMDNASNTATTTFNVILTLATSTATTTPPTFTITHPIFTSGLFCATSTPVLLEGTTAASSTITVVGGLNNATTTSDGSGAWSTMINLASNSTSTVFVTITDSSSNVIGTTTLNFAFDTTDPTITLNGDANMSITQGSTFTDPGVTVSDNLDANVSTSTSGTVNVNVAGTYTITYTATDCAGNTASVERTVTVNPTSSGGGSASGRRNATNNATGSVLGGTVEGTTFVSPLNPFQQVLGASAFIPGLPNTGAGGNASTNLALLLSSLGLAGLGTMVLRKRSQKTR